MQKNKGINVLFLTTISGFLPKFLMQDVGLLQSMGCTVHYASNFDNPIYECDRRSLEMMGIVCHSIPIAKSPARLMANYKAYRLLKRIVDEEDIQVVHCHNPMGGVLGRLLGRSRKLYVIYTAHGFHFYKGASLVNWLCYYTVERFLAASTDQLITINHEDMERAEGFRLKKGGKVTRIPGVGYDRARFVPALEKRELLRRKYGINNEDYLFLSVGELNDNKNHKTIIKAFSDIQYKHKRLFICGAGQKHAELYRLIHKLGIEDRVTLWGYRTNIEEFYQCADCFVFPSYREGLGMAAVEAMACGLPLIVSDNRGTREYAQLFSHNNAFVCEAGKVHEFCQAMEKLCQDRKLSLSMGDESLAVAGEFTQERTKEIMVKIYERMEKALL